MNKLSLKYSYLFFILSVIYSTSGAQNQMKNLIFENDFREIDSSKYEVYYEVEVVTDILKTNEKIIDLQVLQIGEESSFYFSKILFQNDSINTILENQGADYYHSIPKAATKYEIIRDRKTKTFEVTYRSDDIVFRYFEDIPKLNWIIHNEKCTVQQYMCQRATTNFRGREYEAWFTTEIPIRLGPYKFGGLPGLILEIQDSKKHYVFKCIGIKKLKTPKAIKIRKWDYTETTREKLNDFLERKHKNPTNYYNTRGVTLMTKKDGRFVEVSKNSSWPYNPIELE